MPSLRVLVVDDSARQRRFSRVVLESAGCEVFEAADGQIALDLLATDTFDTILLDLHMPVLGGLDVLRSLAEGKHPPIIISSSDANEAAARHPDLFRIVSFVLEKPTAPAALLNAVQLALQAKAIPRASCG